MTRGLRTVAALVLALVVGGCGDDPGVPDRDLLVRVAAARTTVRPGEGIPLTVTRVWRADHEPSPWDASLLEPLILRDEQVTRREARGRIEETRRYRAYVFRLDDVQVPEILFASRPRAGGAVAIARSQPVQFTVVPEVDPASPGAPELPGEPPAGPAAPWLWGGLLALLVLAFESIPWARRRAARRARLAARDAPRLALLAIRGRASETPEAMAVDLAEAADAVRDHLALLGRFDARAQTTEEIAARLLDPLQSDWHAVARPADRSKFAEATIDRSALDGALDRALAIVESGTGGPAGRSPGGAA